MKKQSRKKVLRCDLRYPCYVIHKSKYTASRDEDQEDAIAAGFGAYMR